MYFVVAEFKKNRLILIGSGHAVQTIEESGIHCFDHVIQGLRSKRFDPLLAVRWHGAIEESGLINNLIRRLLSRFEIYNVI